MNNLPIVVFYHTTSPDILHPIPPGTYEKICRRFIQMCAKWKLRVIHLTVSQAELYGDESIVFDDFDPRDIVYNREWCFYHFMSTYATNYDTYLFCEPDMVIRQMFPALRAEADLALLYRHDHKPHLATAWRLARKTALSFFGETAYLAEHHRRDWHGDSEVMNIIYDRMFAGVPPTRLGIWPYHPLNIELRAYEDYIKWRYTYMHHYTAERKLDLLKEKL